MSSVKRRIIIEEYENGSWGCPQFDLMGYNHLTALIEDIKFIIRDYTKNAQS